MENNFEVWQMSTDRTAEQWLTLDDLPTELARVFTPGNGVHQYKQIEFRQPTIGIRYKCVRCNKEWNSAELPHGFVACSVPNPITIDWNTAMEWRDKVHAIRWDDAMYVIYRAASHASVWRYSDWLRRHAQPKHYLIAAAMAAERKEE